MENKDIKIRGGFWEDKGFVAEMKNRIAEYEKGELKCSDWEEVKQRTRLSS